MMMMSFSRPQMKTLAVDEVAEVARVEPRRDRRAPALLNDSRRELGLLVVAARDARPARDDLTDLALAEAVACFVDDRDLVIRERAAAVDELLRAVFGAAGPRLARLERASDRSMSVANALSRAERT